MCQKCKEDSTEKCEGCGKSIVSGKMVKEFDKHWHSECFTCVRCKKKFD